MNKMTTWKSLRSEYSVWDIIDGFLGAFLYAFLIFFPVFLGLVELITVYMYLLTFLSFMIIIELFGFVVVIHLFWKKSLKLKMQEHKTDITKLFIKNTLIVNGVILVIGILVIYVLIPILFV